MAKNTVCLTEEEEAVLITLISFLQKHRTKPVHTEALDFELETALDCLGDDYDRFIVQLEAMLEREGRLIN